MERSAPPGDRPKESVPAKVTSPAGFSQFVGKVLDQLSLSAWLPAAMLVGGSAVVLQMHANKQFDISRAVRDLSAKPLGILIVSLFALVLATLVTQAFEFEVIRVLEGYWGSRPGFRVAARLQIARHKRRLSRLRRQRARILQSAFDEARKDILARGLLAPEKRYLLDAIEDDVYGRTDGTDDELDAEIELFAWKQYASAEMLRRQDSIEAAIEEYPREHRILPTRLGNVMRTVEDLLPIDDDEDLEGLVIRWWHHMPPALQEEHDEYRTRLELYCLLTSVFLALAVIGGCLVVDPIHETAYRYGLAGTFLALAIVSYKAAIASAKGFGVVLSTIGEIVSAASAERESGAPGRVVKVVRRMARLWRR